MKKTFRAGETVNLDEIDDVAGTAVVNGRRVVVRGLDGSALRLLHPFQDRRQAPSLLVLYDVVARCVPELTPEEVDRLTPTQIGILLTIASATVDEFDGRPPRRGSAR